MSRSNSPWQHRRPAGAPKTKLTAAARKLAAKRAQHAGRAHPIRVDSLWAARKQREKEART